MKGQSKRASLYVCIMNHVLPMGLLPGWRENSQTVTDITLGIETNLQNISETIFYQHFHNIACLYVSKTLQNYELMLQFENYFSYFLFKMTLKKCYQQQTDN